MPDWAKTVGEWAALIVGVAAVVGVVGGVARWALRAVRSRQKPQQVWPTRSISGSYRLPSGGSVPMGEYHCPRDARILDLDYPRARGHCAACGRTYELKFPEFGFAIR
jgi:hypothetical protein